MTQNGFREDQVAQVRGLADQRLRKRDAPLDPLNRRTSLIVRYREKPTGAAEGNESPPAEASPPRPRRNRAELAAPSGRKTAIV
jgi:chemotaxis protein MotB